MISFDVVDDGSGGSGVDGGDWNVVVGDVGHVVDEGEVGVETAIDVGVGSAGERESYWMVRLKLRT